MSKEQVGELLEDNDINKILEESIKDSIKDSMISNNPIGILEQLLIN